jgi:hypothetical protein
MKGSGHVPFLSAIRGMRGIYEVLNERIFSLTFDEHPSSSFVDNFDEGNL